MSHLWPSQADSLLSKAVKKYGADNFSWRFLAAGLDEATAFAVERAAISAYGSKVPNGYNLTDGGEGASGFKQSEETKEKRADKLRGRKRGPEFGRHLSAIFKGVPNPKAAEAQRGTARSAEHRASISVKLTGRKQPQDVVDRRNATNRARLLADKPFLALVDAVREALAAGAENQTQIASRLGTTQVFVSAVKLGKTAWWYKPE